jgi:hypothetical protein
MNLSHNSFLGMWLVAHNRCWSAGRLARRGLQHHECCILCDQEEETIDKLMLACIFAQIWFSLLCLVSLQSLCPQPNETSFEWWANAVESF